MPSNGEAACNGPRTAPASRAYWQIALSCIADAASELLLKRGMDGVVQGGHEGGLGLGAAQSGWVWLGITANIASLLWWLAALRTIPLGVAFNLSGAVHVLVQLGCWGLLGEQISTKRWIGIMLVVAGVTVSARPAAAVEEQVEEKIEDEVEGKP